jgi:heme-degrading monooxygenase HmoA
MSTEFILELAIGKTKAEISREDYLQAATDFEADLRGMPGFRGRQLLAGADNLWVDLVAWDSLEDALQAAQAFQNIPSALPMIQMLEAETVRMYHLEAVYADRATKAAEG